MKKKTKFFIDSNVWFSAFYKKGVCYKLVKKLISKNFQVVVSQLVLEEIFKNIGKKFPKTLADVYQFFEQYPIVVVKNPSLKQLKKHKSLADRKDLPILVSAINFECDFFITGNTKDFKIKKIKEKFGLKIITPKKALTD